MIPEWIAAAAMIRPYSAGRVVLAIASAGRPGADSRGDPAITVSLSYNDLRSLCNFGSRETVSRGIRAAIRAGSLEMVPAACPNDPATYFVPVRLSPDLVPHSPYLRREREECSPQRGRGPLSGRPSHSEAIREAEAEKSGVEGDVREGDLKANFSPSPTPLPSRERNDSPSLGRPPQWAVGPSPSLDGRDVREGESEGRSTHALLTSKSASGYPKEEECSGTETVPPAPPAARYENRTGWQYGNRTNPVRKVYRRRYGNRTG